MTPLRDGSRKLAGEIVSAAPTTDDDDGKNCDDARTRMMSKMMIRGVFVLVVAAWLRGNGHASMQMRRR